MFAITNDKWALYEFMNQRDLPCLPTVCVGRPGEILDVPEDSSIEFPALLKPVSESGGYGIVKVTNYSDLERAWHDKRIINDQEYILQNYIPAVDYSLSVCCKDGEIIAYTSNRAIVPSERTFGLGRFFAYVNNEQIIDIGRRLVSALEWNGVADIDFLVDNRDQKIWILEFNPRFWQSLLGGLIAGVNFPLIWCLSALDINFSCNQHETTKYLNLSLYINELFSRLFRRAQNKDVHWYQTNLKFISTDPLPEAVEVIRRLNKKIRRKFTLHPKHKKAFS